MHSLVFTVKTNTVSLLFASIFNFDFDLLEILEIIIFLKEKMNDYLIWTVYASNSRQILKI